MKRIFYNCLMIGSISLLALSNSELHAQDIVDAENTFYSDFYVMEVKPMQFQITYHYPIADHVKIRILDAQRNILFTQKALVYKKYHKSFDLSSFVDGRYTFELYDGDREFRKSFDVVTKTTRIVTARSEQSIETNGLGN